MKDVRSTIDGLHSRTQAEPKLVIGKFGQLAHTAGLHLHSDLLVGWFRSAVIKPVNFYRSANPRRFQFNFRNTAQESFAGVLVQFFR
jgi:hypothetical protein